jgi:GntR family transcriptional regulator
MAWTFDEKSPIYLQIAYRVKLKIASKELSMGQQLLPVREFAQEAGVNPNTMQRALAQLETEGLVRTERTAGRYVTEDTALIEQLRADTARTLASDFLEKMRGIGYSPAQTAALLEHWDAKEDRNE